MKVTTVLEGKIVLFIATAKIPEPEGSYSPFRFYGQLSDYESHVFGLIHPVGEFSFKGVKMWGQSEISSCPRFHLIVLYFVRIKRIRKQGELKILFYNPSGGNLLRHSCI